MELESASLRLNVSGDWLFSTNGFPIPEELKNEFSNIPLSPPTTFETLDFDTLLVENENSDDSTSSPQSHITFDSNNNFGAMEDIKPSLKSEEITDDIPESMQKKKRGRKRKVATDDPTVLKEIHKVNEKRRRDDIRTGFDTLKQIIPGINAKDKNTIVLDKTIQHINVLNDQMSRLTAELDKLKSNRNTFIATAPMVIPSSPTISPASTSSDEEDINVTIPKKVKGRMAVFMVVVFSWILFQSFLPASTIKLPGIIDNSFSTSRILTSEERQEISIFSNPVGFMWEFFACCKLILNALVALSLLGKIIALLMPFDACKIQHKSCSLKERLRAKFNPLKQSWQSPELKFFKNYIQAPIMEIFHNIMGITAPDDADETSA